MARAIRYQAGRIAMARRALLSLLVFVLSAPAAFEAGAEPPRRIVVGGLGRLPAFSHATVAGDLVFVSGTLGTLPGSMRLAVGGAGPQTAQAMRNIQAILAATGASLADVAKCTVFLRDMQDYPAMNAAYLPFFGGSPPARSAIAAKDLAAGADVEIECIAALPRSDALDPPPGAGASSQP
jgi:reactive intermediate/imine deaminase